MLQIAEPGFHQHAPFGTTRRDARRVSTGAASGADESGARLSHGRFRSTAQHRMRVETTPHEVRAR
ncbi:hypothetical protein WI96_03120 [Burkholderia vietnamiensis]|nr:hypothetical protein WI96_03120 [Burkholderia vietnamiensis]KVF98104.1 hypothetical protein WJ21_15015 [Burkholderia vietnamiensis]KVR91588.1 hypothetical protein WK28_20420 [Burkholderia vietnamiensis]